MISSFSHPHRWLVLVSLRLSSASSRILSLKNKIEHRDPPSLTLFMGNHRKPNYYSIAFPYPSRPLVPNCSSVTVKIILEEFHRLFFSKTFVLLMNTTVLFLCFLQTCELLCLCGSGGIHLLLPSLVLRFDLFFKLS